MAKKAVKPKHVPMRTCIVTRVKKPKNDLIRIVKDLDGKISIDARGKIKGRGASIDAKVELLDQALSKGILKKALKLERALSDDEVKNLKQEFKEAVADREFRKSNKPVKIRITRQDMDKLTLRQAQD